MWKEPLVVKEVVNCRATDNREQMRTVTADDLLFIVDSIKSQ